jgi:hypothetical protein
VETAAIVMPGGHGGLGGIGNVGAVGGQFLQIVARAEGEDAAVPAIGPFGQKGHGAFRLGFSTKRSTLNPPAPRFAALHIAKAGFGRGGGDAKGHQPACFASAPAAVAAVTKLAGSPIW